MNLFRDKQFIREFKLMVIRMLKELSESNKSIKNNQLEMKNVMSEIQNTLEGIASCWTR